MKSIIKINEHLTYIESVVSEHQVKNPSVSSNSVGWQIDHCLKVFNNIINYLKTAPTDKASKISISGRLFLGINYIPRGKGKAPKLVLPNNDITTETLQSQLGEAKENLQSISSLDPQATFKHSYFGVLDLKQSIRFVEVHTNHHIKIIKDILK